MRYKESDTVIGFSGLDLFEECYGYNEDACFIGDTRAAAEQFMEDSLMGSGDFRIDAVTIDEVLSDFGSSLGEFAMEADAFRRFSTVAAANGIRFEARPFDGDESLMVVEVEGARYSPET